MAAAVLLTGIALSGCSNDPDRSTAPAFVVPADFPDAPPAAPADWSGVEPEAPIVGGLFGGPNNQFAFGATAYRDGFVVVGEDLGSGVGVDAAIWVSPDGVEWSRVEDPDAGLKNAQIDEVATDGRRLVAAGTVRGKVADPGPFETVIWTSEDGESWRRSLGSAQFEGVFIAGLVGSTNGFAAWGTTFAGQWRISLSPDGIAWRPVDMTRFAGNHVSRLRPYRGGWLAVGSVDVDPNGPIGGPPGRGRAWWSADGMTWFDARVADGPALVDAFPGSRGVLGLGARECSRCVGPWNVWQSLDGRTWDGPVEDAFLAPTYATDGQRIVRWDYQGARELSWSSDGAQWHSLGTIPRPADNSGLAVVGSRGVLLVLHDADAIDVGVQFLRATP